MILDELKDWFYELMYKLQSGICYLIDFIKEVFFKLCGLDTVKVNGEDKDLVSSLVQSNTIHRVFLTVFLIGVILLVIFLIIALIRANYQGNEKKSRGAIMAKAGQSFLICLLVPFLLLAGMTLVSTIMGSLNNAMQMHITDSPSKLGGQMLITSGYNAFKGSAENREAIETMFLTGELDYNNLGHVRMFYNIHDVNYVIGIFGGLVMLIMFAISSITFIQRIFDIILLYIVSPISISTIPLDDGNRFRVWKDMLIAKILGAYGIILVMNLFFLIMPQISSMQFFDNSFQNSLVDFLFIIGGAFAVTKANLVISQLCGAQAGGREFAQMIYNFRSGLAFMRATGGIIGGTVGRVVGGTDYLKNRKKGNTKGESLNMALHSTRNQQTMQQGQKTKGQKAKQYGGAVTRLATMPVGVVKDFMQGGIIQAGKNLGPRLRNVATGTTLTNRAEIRPKIPQGTDMSAEETKDTTATTETVNTGETMLKTESERVESADDKTTSGATTDTSSDRGVEETTADKSTTATTDTSSVREKERGASETPKTEVKGDTKGGTDNT